MGVLRYIMQLMADIPISNLILESTSPRIKEEANQLERRLVDDARAKVLDIAGIELFVNDWGKVAIISIATRITS